LKAHVRTGRILDVGTATGFFLEVAQAAGFEPYGVEISEYSGAIAAKKFGAGRIHIGTLETAPFPAGSFDAIAMTDLIEHVTTPVDTLRLAHRFLKPGGVVILTTPNSHSLSRKLMGRSWTHYKMEHLFYMNPRAIQVIAQKAGFRLVLCRSAEKTMSIGYLHSQLLEYRHWALTPAIRLVAALFRPFVAHPIHLKMGEIVVILEKP
jgi:ubiquinone/menaquinone biosynthesis C-methylase UbiE